MARASSSNRNQEQEEDRLSALPNILLLMILSFVDLKQAVQCSILSKRWVNLWTSLGVLNFDSSAFQSQQNYPLAEWVNKLIFDYFIDKVIALRDKEIKITDMNVKATDHGIMNRLFRYALLNEVKNLSIDTSENLSRYFVMKCELMSKSLLSLSLKGMLNFGRFPSFTNLVSLRLERVKIVDVEPFTSFPILKELFLVNCKLMSNLAVLGVIGYQLKRLIISSCLDHLNPFPFKKLWLCTPNLMLLEIDGLIPMPFEAHGLSIVDTIYIDCYSSDKHNIKEQKLNMINIFRGLRNAKRVHLSPSTVEVINNILYLHFFNLYVNDTN